jgi:hypothetical protein
MRETSRLDVDGFEKSAYATYVNPQWVRLLDEQDRRAVATWAATAH